MATAKQVSEWQTTTLGMIARSDDHGLVDGPFGSNLPALEYVMNGIPIIRGSNLTLGEAKFRDDEFVFASKETASRLSRSICRGGDIIFTKKGTLGQTGIIPLQHKYKEFLLSSNQMKLSVDLRVADPLYVYYYVSSPLTREKIIRDAESTGVPKTNLAYLRTFPILLPPLPEQRAIARVLGSLDDKIELNRKLNATLEATTRVIFNAWFVEFEPVRAKMQGRAPQSCDAATAALFPAALEMVEGREVPRGWNVVLTSDLGSINSWTLGRNDNLETIEYIEISEVSKGNINKTQIYKRGDEPSRARRRLRHGDTVLSTVRPDRGSYFLCLEPTENLIASTGFAVFTPTKTSWSHFFTALTMPEVFDYLGQQADGGAYPAVSPETIGKWQIIWPDNPDVINSFQEICVPLYEQAHFNRKQNDNLATLRDSLLPRLLSGELRVSDAEAIVEEQL